MPVRNQTTRHFTKSKASIRSNKQHLRCNNTYARLLDSHSRHQSKPPRHNRPNSMVDPMPAIDPAILTLHYESSTPADHIYPTTIHTNPTSILLFLMIIAANIAPTTSAKTDDTSTARIWSNQQIRTFQNGNIRTCNKPKHSIALRATPTSVFSTLALGSNDESSCSTELLSMRHRIRIELEKIHASPIIISPDKARQLRNNRCDLAEVANFIKSLRSISMISTASESHRAANCGELSRRVSRAFMTSDNDELQKHRMATVVLDGSPSGDNHVFNVIFTPNDLPTWDNEHPPSFSDLIKRHPHARAIDLWNHLTLPLSAFNSQHDFKLAVSNALRYVLSTGTKPDSRLSKSSQIVTSHAEAYSEQVLQYYKGFTHSTVELLPSRPRAACQLT